MKWLAILLALAGLGGTPTPKAEPGKRCTAASQAKKPQCKKKATKKKAPAKQPTAKKPAADAPSTTPGAQRPGEPAAPGATPTPTATPGATVTPAPTVTVSPTPTPVYPRRTGVDLDEWSITSAYLTLAAGRITFNTNNRGEDEHNLSVRGGGREYGRIDLQPGENGPLALDLAAGNYTLYCSLIGHEAAGMVLDISVR